MTLAVQAPEVAGDSRSDRYRAAERRLWGQFGLEPTEHMIPAPTGEGRIRVVEAGRGVPIVFIGGTGGTGPYWAPLVAELAADHRCLLVDRPGWGLSSPVDYRSAPYGEIATATIERVLDELELERAHVVGASVGNLWAMWFARRTAARVGRIALIGAQPMRGVPVPRFVKLLASPLGSVIARMPFTPKMARSQLEAVGHAASLAAGRLDGFIAWRASLARETASMRQERSMIQAILANGAWRDGFVPTDSDLASMETPTLFLFGSEDPTGNVDVWRAVTERLPDGEFRVIEGAGHMAWWDDPVAVGESIRAFFARTDLGRE